MVWRPVAVMRGPMRRKGRLLDLVALARAGRARRAVLVPPHRHARGRRPVAVPRRVLRHGLATLIVIAAVTHQRARGRAAARQPAAAVDRHPVLRPVPVPLADLPDHPRVAGQPADGRRSSSSAWRITVVITEVSYRFIEMPIRRRHVGALVAPAAGRARSGAAAGHRHGRRRRASPLSVFAVANLATAELKPNEIAQSLDEGQRPSTDPLTELGADGDRRPATAATAARRRRPADDRTDRRPPRRGARRRGRAADVADDRPADDGRRRRRPLPPPPAADHSPSATR